MTGSQRPITIVVSDLHMGAADPYDDFVYQGGEFVTFIDGLATSEDGRQGRIELLINGDFLELAQVRPDAYTLGSSKYWCSESESELKLDAILTGHKDVFAAIGRFQQARNQCTLFAGNHDVELYWEKIQQRIQAVAGPVRFELEKVWYERYNGKLKLSHGHMFDPANSFEHWDNPIRLADDGRKRLEMCAGTMFMVKFVNGMEHEYPFADNIHPNWRLATILWKEAKDGLALAAWLFARFASRHPRFTLGSDDVLADMSRMGDWVVGHLNADEPFRRKVTALWNETYTAAKTPDEILRALATADAIETFMTDVLLRVPQERWLPVFDGVRPHTLQIASSGRWQSTIALREEARQQWNHDAQIVTIGHTHEYDEFSDGSKRYFNTGSWTRSLPWSKDKDLTLARLKDESWFPYNLLFLRVEEQANGMLASEMGSCGRSA